MKYLLVILVLNCSFFSREQPNKKFYSLEINPNKIQKNSIPKFQKLKVNKLRVSPEYEGKEFVYRKELVFETDFYNQFLVSPSTNITEQLIQALNYSKLSSLVTNRILGTESNLNLEGNINSLYVDFSKSKIYVSLELELYLTDSTKEEVIFRKNYNIKKEIKEKNIDEYVKTWNGSLTEIFNQLILDLNSLNLK